MVSQPRLGHRKVSPETIWLSIICMADLMTTLWWVSQGTAREGNPVMAYFLGYGPATFILAKIGAFLPALVIAEWYRPRNPELICRVMRWVIGLYLAIYLAGVAAHTGRPFEFYADLLLR